MAKINKLSKSVPAAVDDILKKLGRNIRTARLRRGMSIVDLARHVGVSRYLISDIENGKPSASISVYLTALWAMGLVEDLWKIADPDHDAEGKALESIRAPKTAAKRKKNLDNDF